MSKLLIVVDMQNDFIDCALGTPEAVAIVDNVANKIKSYKSNGDVVIFTRDTHQENYLETNEGKHLPVVHCVEGTSGWEISDKLDTEGAKIINKPSFGYTLWENEKLDQYDEVELIGLCTDICVISNALIIKALYPELKVTLDSSCCAGVTPASHDAALLAMKMCQVEVY